MFVKLEAFDSLKVCMFMLMFENVIIQSLS